jgi:hypothetical protein
MWKILRKADKKVIVIDRQDVSNIMALFIKDLKDKAAELKIKVPEMVLTGLMKIAG